MKKFNVLKGGYRFNKVLLKYFFVAIAVLVLPQLLWSLNAGFFGDGWVSFECVGVDRFSGSCYNPYFGSCEKVDFASWCSSEFLPDGFVYNPLPWFYDWYQIPSLLLFFGYFLLNDRLYNKAYWKGEDEKR